MRRAAELHGIANGQALGGLGLLLDEGEAPGDGASGELAHRRAVEHHLAAAGPVDAGEKAQERRLARSVRADDAEPLAGGDGDVHAVEDGAAAGVAAERGGGEAHAKRRARTRMKAKAGAPISAVTTPMTTEPSGWYARNIT